MKNTVAFIDTDVLIDYLCKRQPFYENAKRVFVLRQNNLYIGYISTQSVANIFFTLRKQLAVPERKNLLLSVCRLFPPCNISSEMTFKALEDETFSDFEDHIQMQCAVNVNADFIVTRNIKDFTNSKIKALTPDEFLTRF
jgi:predicted nucleic acid-binding protein